MSGLRDLVLALRRRSPGVGPDQSSSILLLHLASLAPLRAGDLAEHACLDPSTVSRHLKALDEEGRLVRTPDPDDRRATLLGLSPDGRRRVAQAQAERLALVTAAVSTWSDDDVDTLNRLVRRLADSLEGP